MSVCSLLHLPVLFFHDHEQEMQKRPSREFLKLKPKITQLNSHSEKYWCLKKLFKGLPSQSTLNPPIWSTTCDLSVIVLWSAPDVCAVLISVCCTYSCVLFSPQLTGIRQSQIDGRPHMTEVLDKVWLAQSQIASIV